MKQHIPFTLGTLQGWWAADRTPGYADLAPVPSIPDLTPNNRDWSQAIGARQPAFVVGARNGLPAFRFSGAQRMENDALATVFNANPLAIAIFAAYSWGGGGAEVVLGLGNLLTFDFGEVASFAPSDNSPGNLFNGTSGNQTFYSLSPGFVGAVAGGFRYQGGVGSGLVNGEICTGTNQAVETLAIQKARIGCRYLAGAESSFLNGDLYELFIVTGNNINLAKGVAYLQNKWGI